MDLLLQKCTQGIRRPAMEQMNTPMMLSNHDMQQGPYVLRNKLKRIGLARSEGGGSGRGDDLGPQLVAPSLHNTARLPVNGLIHERPPLSRQSGL
ncbi:hypothetical protein EYF80_023431 [Liparis tanakae]|uniref:Uncharacterized protein n=1 Tax=Liparis tanakae TaxID=230148 RepID=A0A4Z2HNP6_9TELE|nr:hypothetical protein EYF80_023431 [Liparis tanakae]